MELIEEIDNKVGEVRFEGLDMSFGELVSLHSAEQRELVIAPEYQRLFRWSNEQRSRLIESVILELPIPQIFMIENEDGVLELIDGLQRVSSVFQFMDSKSIGLEPLELEGCDLVKSLNGKRFEDLPLTLRLRIKRSSVRVLVIKRQSESFLRYEMFKRLNTGGAELAPQELRNCSARMLGEKGKAFYEFLRDCAGQPDFESCTQTISSAEAEKMGAEELVLRFLATKNSQDTFKGSVRDWLDAYMESIILEKVPFDYDAEQAFFARTFAVIASALGVQAFVKHRHEEPIGALAPAYFESVTGAISGALDAAESLSSAHIKQKIIECFQSDEFKANTGPGANSKPKLERRIGLISEAVFG